MVSIDLNSINNMKTPRNAKDFSESKRAFYLFGFNTVIKKATDLDISNKTLYGIQLIQNYHSLILPVRLKERKTTGTIFSQDKSYYAYLGKMIIGILYISVRNFTKTRTQIEYNYKYKVDGRTYNVTTNKLKNYTKSYKNISKHKANNMSAANTRKHEKEKIE